MKNVLLGAAGAAVALGLGLVGYKVLSSHASTTATTAVATPATGVVAYQPPPAATPTPPVLNALPGWATTANALIGLTGTAFNTGLGIMKAISP